MIAYRKTHPALLKGGYMLVEADDTYLSFIRKHGNVEVFCAFNISDTPRDVTLPEGQWHVDTSAPFEVQQTDSGLKLPGWQALFATTSG